MEENNTNEITLEQALQAEEYVKSCIRFYGGDPNEVMMQPGYEKHLPADAQKAVETFREFWTDKEEKGILL